MAVPQIASSDIICVTETGGGGCFASINQALDAAGKLDTIRVAKGNYEENLVIEKNVVLEGGWDEAFKKRDVDKFETTIQGDNTSSVITVKAGYNVTIDGFSITRGNASDSLGWGGGIRVGESFNDEGYTIIRNNTIYKNVAADSSGQGEGGGIHVYNHTALIENNRIFNNSAQRVAGESGKGGGVCLGWRSNVTLKNNDISTNTASISPVAPSSGSGGGVYSDSTDITLENNRIYGNLAARNGLGYGGGVYLSGYLLNNSITNNTASRDGEGHGGGAYIEYGPRVQENYIAGNTASANAEGSGGGICALQMQRCFSNTILDNVASRGGGVVIKVSSYTEFRDNTVKYNHATGTDNAAMDGGGGLYVLDNNAVIEDNIITENRAERTGGGVYLIENDDCTVENNVIQKNTAANFGGGVASYSADGNIIRNNITDNQAGVGGGVILEGDFSPNLLKNIITDNYASGFFAAGGGICINLEATGKSYLRNNIIARNKAGASGRGGGIVITGGVASVYNNTVVDNDVGDYKEGILVSSTDDTHIIKANIICGHSNGIELLAGVTASLDYNDYYDNDSNVVGGIAGSDSMTQNPYFKSRANGDYHLTGLSRIVDKGMLVKGMTEDFEGDPRPHNSKNDIGADEFYHSNIFVSAKFGNDKFGDGSPEDPYASVTKGLEEVQTGGTVHVARGEYTGVYEILRSVELLGGYSNDDWGIRDVWEYETILNGDEAGTVLKITGKTNHSIIEGFTIQNGKASFEGGGAILWDDASAEIRWNTIKNNEADNNAAGIHFYNDSGRECIIDGNRIFNNTAYGTFHPCSGEKEESSKFRQGPGHGGGMVISGGPTTVMNNFIYSNCNPLGGDGMVAASYNGEPVKVINNTFFDNGVTTGQAIYCKGSPFVTIYNNIIAEHYKGISNTSGESGDPNIDYNCYFDNVINIEGETPGPHAVFGNPALASPETGYLHICNISAARDAGCADPEFCSDHDIDNNARPYGGGLDIGADEAEDCPPWFAFTSPGDEISMAKSSFNITWNDDDSEQNAEISLYVDDNREGFNGTLLDSGIMEDDITNEYPWNVEAVEENTWWVYAIVDDGVNPPVYKYSNADILVTHITQEEAIRHILDVEPIHAWRHEFADLDQDGGVSSADMIMLLNLP